MKRSRAFMELIYRMSFAGMICLVTWLLRYHWPWSQLPALARLAVRIIDLPVALVGRIIPWTYGIDLWFADRTVEFADKGAVLVAHLIVGVPTYTALIYVASRMRNWFRAPQMAAPDR